MSEARVAVIGIGNALLGDDALGPEAVRALERDYVVPEVVEIVDVGTAGLDLVGYLLDRERVIFVDAIADRAPAGSLRTVGHDELLATPILGPRIAPHEPAIRDALAVADLAGRAPREAVLVGVVPASTDVGIGLSPEVAAVLPRAVDEIVRQLGRFGIAVTPRDAEGAR